MQKTLIIDMLLFPETIFMFKNSKSKIFFTQFLRKELACCCSVASIAVVVACAARV